MAYGKFKNTGGCIKVDLGSLNPKQKLFCQARSRYVGYGGARGGGKTHVSRVKAFGGAMTYPGIKILFVRREYPELEQTVILPMREMIPAELASYRSGSVKTGGEVNNTSASEKAPESSETPILDAVQAQKNQSQTPVLDMAQKVQTQPVQQQVQSKEDPLLNALLSGKRVEQSQANNQQFDALAERGDIGVDAGGNLYQMNPAEHIDQRNQETVKNRSVNAFQ